MLELHHVRHDYGNGPVLEDISLKLSPGERLCLMGPSGRGKTTLLKIAMGLLTPTGGAASNTFRRIAVVFQEPRLLPWRTAAENVNLVLGDTPATMPRAKEWLSRVELAPWADKFPGELSGGMQQRLALARALALEGDLLILDEPFKAMDADLRRRMMALTARTDGAVLLVTHEEGEGQALNCEILRI